MKTLKLLSIVLVLCLLGPAAYAQDYYIYVSDAANFNGGDFKIVQFDPNGENPVRYIDEELNWPQDIVFLEAQNRVLVSNLNSGRITRYNAQTGAYIDNFAIVAGGPTRMRIGPDDKLWVIQWSNTNNKVLRYELDGTLIGEYSDTGIITSIGIDWDDNDNFYVSSFNGGNVTEYNAAGIEQGVFADTELSGPTNVEIQDGTMYVLDWNAGKCVRYDVANGTYIDDFITGLTNPEGIAFLPDGSLLIGDNGTNSVRQFDAGGNDLGDYTTGGDLITPNAVVLRDAVNLSTPDLKAELVLVSPTVGSQFNFNREVLVELNKIEIFDTTGSLVDTLNPANTTTWNAGHLANGVYFMVATNQRGEQSTQKIVVRK